MTYYIDLDFTSTDTQAADYDLKIIVLREYGPAGGNPYIRLTGSYDNLTDYIWNEYSKDDNASAEFISSLINELPKG